MGHLADALLRVHLSDLLLLECRRARPQSFFAAHRSLPRLGVTAPQPVTPRQVVVVYVDPITGIAGGS
jgi:hypothetical protein